MIERKSSTFSFANIDVLSKTLNAKPSSFNPGDNVLHNISVELKVDVKRASVGAFAKCEVRSEDNQVLTTLNIVCEFDIEDFENIIVRGDDGLHVIPDFYEALIVPISISTMRGILYSQLQGTYLETAIIPVVFFNQLGKSNESVKDE